VILEFFHLPHPIDALCTTRPGEPPVPIDKDRLASWKAASAVLSERASDAGIAPAVESDLADLGSTICEAAYAFVKDELDRDVLLYLRPQGDAKAAWCTCEEILWEAAAKDGRFLIDRDIAVIRGFGDAAIDPINTADKPVRVLFVCANPAGAGTAKLDPERALTQVRQAWATWILRPEDRVIEGPHTCEQLKQLAEEDRQWDIIHVIAHGSRSSRSIQLEGRAVDSGGHGSPDWVEFDKFAHLLGTLEPPRLITLNVCDSSPLALELMAQFGGKTRVMGLLARGNEDSVLPFFARFYERLFAPADKPRPDAPVYVEQAYLEAAQHLRLQRLAQWFLPVIYSPTSLSPLLAPPQVECQLRGILDRVENNWENEEAVQDALDDLKGLFKHESAAVRARAAEFHQAIGKLRQVEANYERLLHDIRVRRPWSAVYDDWHALPVTIRRTFSPEAVDLDTTVVSTFDALQRTLDRLNELADAAVDAVRHLARFEGGEVPALSKGCERLDKVFPALRQAQGTVSLSNGAGGSDAAPFASEVFEKGVTALLEQCGAVKGQGSAVSGQPPSTADCLGALGAIARLLRESGTRFLPDAGVEALTARVIRRAAEIVREQTGPLVAGVDRELEAMGQEADPLAKVEHAQRALERLAEAQSSLSDLQAQVSGGEDDELSLIHI